MTPVEIARSWIGTPWAHQARGPNFLDCIGLLVKCYPVRDRTDYGRNPHNGQLERVVAEQFGPYIPKDQMRAGDVALMAFPRAVRHVGIVANHWTGGLSIIHTWAGGPRCVSETRIDDAWTKRIRFVHRMEIA